MNIQGVGAGSSLEMTGKAAQQQSRLEAGAHEFEAMMLQQMLKPLKFGQAESTDEEEASGENGTVQGFATEAIAKGIAGKGGLGIARQIIQQVNAEAASKGEARAERGKGGY